MIERISNSQRGQVIRGGQRMETNFINTDDGFSESIHSIQREKNPVVLFQKVQGALRFVPDFGKTCRAILNAVMDEMDAENCSLMLKHTSTDHLIIHAARGKKEPETIYYAEGFPNGKRFKSGEGVAGWVLKEGKALILEDVNQEPRFIRPNGFGKRVRSLICHPVRERDQVVGVFNLSHSKRGAFNEETKAVSAYISQQLGAALTSARFFMEIHEMNRLIPNSKDIFVQELSTRGEESSYPAAFVEAGEVTSDNGLFIYASQKMQHIKAIINRVANTDVTVLIQGESGTGKEVVARSIHLNSFRRDQPFIKVNCAALPSELLESELFGYEKGAFTGAYRQKLGKFDLANGGTMFLDEISEMNLSLQGKLLQVLQDREFSRLGGKKDVRVNTRVLVATNQNIEEAVRQGRFREDLYYRLNVVNIMVPPLRERKEEIPIFVQYFLDKFSKKYGRKLTSISEKTMKIFEQYRWPGNVRELENAIQRIVVLGGEKLVAEEFTPLLREETTLKPKETVRRIAWPTLKEVHRAAMIKAEKEVIAKALGMTNWNRKKAAGLLNISYKALLYKIRECGLDNKNPQIPSN